MTNNLAQTIALQQLASDPKNSSWVFASAGSGKTKVLTDRVLRLLLSGITPDKILCLTFTKVAATEMQNRINSELASWVLFDNLKLAEKLLTLSGKVASNSELKKARVLFAEILDAEEKIKIQTIHSFCQSLVKIFPFEAGIKPNFEVLEEAQEKLLLQKAQKEVLKNCSKNPKLKDLITKINSRLHESTFGELVSELLSKKDQLTVLKEKFFGIDGVIEEIFKKFLVEKNQTAEEIFSNFLQKINQKKVLELALALDKSELVTNKKIATSIKIFFENPSLKNFSAYQLAFFTKENESRKINGKVLEDLTLFQIAEDQKKLISDFCDQLNSHKICNSTALLLKFTDAILEIYAELKSQNAFLDYNDLIVESNRLLANPNFSDWVKMKMDGLFDHILIDESQDTNHQQWNIVKALTEDFFSGISVTNKQRTIFIVGDEKQSIYSFQGAEAHISEEIFSYFREKLRGHPIQFHKINLNNSFRSLPVILEVVDAVFAGEKEKSAITKISDFQGHRPIREGLGHFEIWPQVKVKKEEKPKSKERNYEWEFDFTAQENYSEKEFLAENIAKKIKAWVESGRILKSQSRPLKYSDFMILLRRRTDGFDKILSRFFHQYQIPLNSPSKIKFADSLLIQDLLAAAKFALSPHDDLNLAALLKSPIFGILEEELLEICIFKNTNQTTIFKALAGLPKFSQTLNLLNDLIKNSQKFNSFEFFYFLLEQKNRLKIISRFGSESSEILDKFSLKVFDFCETLSPNLQKFLDFVEKLNPEISLLGEKNNQVLITTIHSAKGLQAPVVIIPDCCFDTNKLRSTKEKISWIDFEQNKLSLPIWCTAKEEENNLLKLAREIKKNEAKDEYLRLLYVAMTRAEDELYIAGSGNTNDEECWYNLIKKSVTQKCWEVEFLDEDNAKIAAQKFEIKNETLGMGYAIPATRSKSNPLAEQTQSHLGLAAAPTHSNSQGFDFAQPSNYGVNEDKILANPSQIKGKLIHKILEIFGKNFTAEKSWLAEIAKKIIAREEFLDIEEKNKIRQEVLNFLSSEQFEKLFSGKVQCEVEVVGNQTLKRIDLLIERENEILIVDYKSDETLPNNIPSSYTAQLKTYEKLIKNLHPQKKISSAILWVKFLKLDLL